MLLTEGSLPSKKKGLIPKDTVYSDVSVLARLAFYENLLIGQEIGVCI